MNKLMAGIEDLKILLSSMKPELDRVTIYNLTV